MGPRNYHPILENKQLRGMQYPEKEVEKMIRSRLELETFCVLDRCDNQLRHRTVITTGQLRSTQFDKSRKSINFFVNSWSNLSPPSSSTRCAMIFFDSLTCFPGLARSLRQHQRIVSPLA